MVIPFLDAALKIVDKLIPDPQAKREAQLEVLKMQQAGEFKEIDAALQIALKQGDVNAVEAASDSFWKSGWRPGVGWIGAVGFSYTVLMQPLLAWASGIWDVPVPPKLETEELMVILTGILGLGGYRSVEKIKRVA